MVRKTPVPAPEDEFTGKRTRSQPQSIDKSSTKRDQNNNSAVNTEKVSSTIVSYSLEFYGRLISYFLLDFVLQETKKKSIPAQNNNKTSQKSMPNEIQTFVKKTKAMCLNSTKVTLSCGDLCFAKVRGYSEWPAIVIGVEGKTIEVKFFNSGTTLVYIKMTAVFQYFN